MQKWSCPTAVAQTGRFQAFIKCDVVPSTDIFDAANWAALITAGDMRLTPEGVWSLPDPDTQQNEYNIGCKSKRQTYIKGFTAPFSTQEIDVNDLGHFEYMDDIWTNSASYRMVLIDCLGWLYIDYDVYKAWLDGGKPAVFPVPANLHPGYEFTWDAVPRPGFDDDPFTNGTVSWTPYLSTSNPLAAIKVPGLLTALIAADA